MKRAPGDKSATRAEAQRHRILDAAEQCFIADGFHAATMAMIAERAGISVGLTYRYFASKQAIVLAIIERQLQLTRARIASLHGSVDLVTGLVECFQELRAGARGVMNATLFLEMSAEATRVPGIAAALRHADEITRGDFEAWLSRAKADGGHGLRAREAAAAALLMNLLFAGLAVRAVRDPDLRVGALRRAVALGLAATTSTPTAAGSARRSILCQAAHKGRGSAVD